MSDWKRTTKEIPVESLAPNLVSTIREHVERYNLGSILSDALMCVQTDSEKVKKGLFGGGSVVKVGAVVTPRWLIWAIDDGKGKPATLSALLNDVVIQDYAQTSFAKMVPDSGIEVSGRFTDASENISAFVGIEENAAGRKFIETVIQAAQDAKK